VVFALACWHISAHKQTACLQNFIFNLKKETYEPIVYRSAKIFQKQSAGANFFVMHRNLY
jgi:hypothetical protein